MQVSFDEFLENVETVRQQIAEACALAGRKPDSVKLMAVTKTHGPEAVDYAGRAGLPCVGENRVQEGAAKRPRSEADIPWELIGHLQTNKARLALEHFDRIQSVDRIKLLNTLERLCAESGRVCPILLQVNAGADPAKYGVTMADAPALLETALACAHLKVEGLMTIAPLDDNPDVAARCFERLRNTRDRLQEQFQADLSELSMGMSGDMAEAIRAGSTMVRVGTALFGARE